MTEVKKWQRKSAVTQAAAEAQPAPTVTEVPAPAAAAAKPVAPVIPKTEPVYQSSSFDESAGDIAEGHFDITFFEHKGPVGVKVAYNVLKRSVLDMMVDVKGSWVRATPGQVLFVRDKIRSNYDECNMHGVSELPDWVTLWVREKYEADNKPAAPARRPGM